MAHGLEARSPFLGHKLIKFAASIPACQKMGMTQTKKFLKSATAGRLPEDFLNRPKMGYRVLIDRWIRNELREMCYDILFSSAARARVIPAGGSTHPA